MCVVFNRRMALVVCAVCVGWVKQDMGIPSFDEQGLEQAYEEGLLQEERYMRLLGWLREPLVLCDGSYDDWMALPYVDEEDAEALKTLCAQKTSFLQDSEVRAWLGMSVQELQFFKMFVSYEKQTFHMRERVLVGSKGYSFAMDTLAENPFVRGHVGWVLQPYNKAAWNQRFLRVERVLENPSVRVSKASVVLQKNNHVWWLGHYQAGMGEGLTFAKGSYAAHDGVSKPTGMLEHVRDARFTEGHDLLGVAFEWKPRQQKGFSAVLCASAKPRSVYQYDMQYGDGQNSVWEYEKNTSLRYVSFWDMALEPLWAGRLSWHSARKHVLGLVWHDAYTVWGMPEQAHMRYAVSARMPVSGRSSALGVYVRCAFDRVSCGAEITSTRQGALGVVARMGYRPHALLRMHTYARYYGPSFDNPYTQTYAAPDESEGSRARDEAGVQHVVSFGHVPKVSVYADLWQKVSLKRWAFPFYAWGGSYVHLVGPYETLRWGLRALGASSHSLVGYVVLQSLRKHFQGVHIEAQWGAYRVAKDIQRKGAVRVVWRKPLSDTVSAASSVRYATGTDAAWTADMQLSWKIPKSSIEMSLWSLIGKYAHAESGLQYAFRAAFAWRGGVLKQ